MILLKQLLVDAFALLLLWQYRSHFIRLVLAGLDFVTMNVELLQFCNTDLKLCVHFMFL